MASLWLPQVCATPEVSIVDVVELSLDVLVAELERQHRADADPAGVSRPSDWLVPVISSHLRALRDTLATYKVARRLEQDERLF